jgi:hypothetical protein
MKYGFIACSFISFLSSGNLKVKSKTTQITLIVPIISLSFNIFYQFK